jgi:hypothetical protein
LRRRDTSAVCWASGMGGAGPEALCTRPLQPIPVTASRRRSRSARESWHGGHGGVMSVGRRGRHSAATSLDRRSPSRRCVAAQGKPLIEASASSVSNSIELSPRENPSLCLSAHRVARCSTASSPLILARWSPELRAACSPQRRPKKKTTHLI